MLELSVMCVRHGRPSLAEVEGKFTGWRSMMRLLVVAQSRQTRRLGGKGSEIGV